MVASPNVDLNSSDDVEGNGKQQGALKSLEQGHHEGGMSKEGVEDHPFSKGKLFWSLNLFDNAVLEQFLVLFILHCLLEPFYLCDLIFLFLDTRATPSFHGYC